MRTLASTGLALSIVGAALDFASGYTTGLMPSGGMEVPSIFTILLYLLGGVVVVVGILLVAPSMARRMKWFGLLMEVLGVVMALASAWIPGMNAGLSDAMLIVGALMILNGALMQTRRKMEMR